MDEVPQPGLLASLCAEGVDALRFDALGHRTDVTHAFAVDSGMTMSYFREWSDSSATRRPGRLPVTTTSPSERSAEDTSAKASAQRLAGVRVEAKAEPRALLRVKVFLVR